MPNLKKKKKDSHTQKMWEFFQKRFWCLIYFLYLCTVKTNKGREANSVEALDWKSKGIGSTPISSTRKPLKDTRGEQSRDTLM